MSARAVRLIELKPVIERAKGFVERGWTQFYNAINGEGKAAYYWADDAVCWCASGAISKAGGTDFNALNVFCDANGIENCFVVDWNDAPERTQEEVIAAFDRTLAYIDSELAKEQAC